MPATGISSGCGDVIVNVPASNVIVPTGRFNDDGCEAISVVELNSGVPNVLGLYYFNAIGALQPIMDASDFNKPLPPSPIAPQVSFDCRYITDLTTGASRQAWNQCIVNFNTDGTIASSTNALVLEDKSGPETVAGTEVVGKEEQCVNLGQETVAVDGATDATLTIPANAKSAVVQVDPDSGAIRYTLDGSTPTNDSFAASAGGFIRLCKESDLNDFRALAADESGAIDAGAGAASLQVVYASTEQHP